MFNEKMKLNESFNAQVIRGRQMADFLDPRGLWNLEHFNKCGNKVGEYQFSNLVPTAAKNALFDTMFNAATQIAANSWFAGLVNNSGWTAFAAADTHASHGGWTEWTTYSQSTRPLWGQGSAASAAITNASQIVFSITGSGTIKGLFIASLNTKGSTSGSALLWAEGAYSGTIPVDSGDEIRSTYTLSA